MVGRNESDGPIFSAWLVPFVIEGDKHTYKKDSEFVSYKVGLFRHSQILTLM